METVLKFLDLKKDYTIKKYDKKIS